MNKSKINIGSCLWLLNETLPERVHFLHKCGFDSVSLLQGIMTSPKHEKEEAAAEIRKLGMKVTYHGNIHQTLNDNGQIDWDFAYKLFDDVIWWHEKTNGVMSCCSDAIQMKKSDSTREFLWDLNLEFVKKASEKLSPFGIKTGIENSFGPGSYSSIDDFRKMKSMLKDVHGAGMLLDLAHAHIYTTHNGIDIADYISEIPFDIHEVHISDNHGVSDEHFAPGCGTLPLEKAIRAVLMKNTPCAFSLEICKNILAGEFALDIRHAETAEKLKSSMASVRKALDRPVA